MNNGPLAISISSPLGHDNRGWFGAYLSIGGSKFRAIDIHVYPSEIYIAQHTRLFFGQNNHHTATALLKTLGAHRSMFTFHSLPIHSELPPSRGQCRQTQTNATPRGL